MWVNLCQWGFIASLPEFSIQNRVVSIWALLISFVILLNQLPFMISGFKIFDNFDVFLSVSVLFVLSVMVSSAIKSSSDVFMQDGVLPSKKGRVYIVIKRPKTMIDYFLSVSGSHVSSVSFCLNDKWIKYSQKNGSAKECSLKSTVGYTFIDSGIDATEAQETEFKAMINKPWSWSRNCVTSWYRFTYGTYLEHRPWELLPSSYVKRITDTINKKQK
tara:strand:- start:22326 stop:22976 length:651 start_codon:yes stop_codon:yes gene_type:complete